MNIFFQIFYEPKNLLCCVYFPQSQHCTMVIPMVWHVLVCYVKDNRERRKSKKRSHKKSTFTCFYNCIDLILFNTIQAFFNKYFFSSSHQMPEMSDSKKQANKAETNLKAGKWKLLSNQSYSAFKRKLHLVLNFILHLVKSSTALQTFPPRSNSPNQNSRN